MYETVKARFPHLSDEDRLDIAQFAIDYALKENIALWNRIERIEEAHKSI